MLRLGELELPKVNVHVSTLHSCSRGFRIPTTKMYKGLTKKTLRRLLQNLYEDLDFVIFMKRPCLSRENFFGFIQMLVN